MSFSSLVCETGEIMVNSGSRLTIETAEEFSRIVRGALEASDNVVIVFDPAVEFDVTGIQILCSACKSAAKNNKIFSYEGPQPEALAALVVASGAKRHVMCKHNNNATCSWFGGAN